MAKLTQEEVLNSIPLRRVEEHLEAPTARLREIRRQLKLFAYGPAELELFKKDIDLQVKALNA